MAWKLIYTSAPRLLQAGRSGFGTVARHREIPPLVAETAEKSSQFSRQTGLDPARVIFSYRVARSSAGNFHLFTCISDAGTDYSGRTNHLAEHLILSDGEALVLEREGKTPAGVMLAYDWPGYIGQAGWLGDEDLWQPSAMDANTGGSHWQAATTDANRIKLLAGAEAQSGAVLEYPAHYQSEAHAWILWLFAESQCLCLQSGWGITFTTNVQPTDSLSDFRWIGVPDGSPMIAKLRAAGRLVFNFETPAPQLIPHPAEVSGSFGPVAHGPESEHKTVESSSPLRPQNLQGGSRSSPPPEKPVAKKAEKNPRSKLLVPLLIIGCLVAVGIVAFAFMPGRKVAPTTPALSATPMQNREGAHTAFPQEKAATDIVVSPVESKNVSTALNDSPKEMGAKKTAVPPAEANASSSDLKPEAPAPQAPKGTIIQKVILLPDNLENFSWPANPKTTENLEMFLVDKSGGKRRLTPPKKLASGEKFYVIDNGVQILRAAGKDMLPTGVVGSDPVILEVNGKNSPEDIWRIYIPAREKSLSSIAPPDDPLRLNQLLITADSNASFVKFRSPDILWKELIDCANDSSGNDESAVLLYLEASYPEPASTQSARGQGMLDAQTARNIGSITIPIDDKGQLAMEEAKKPYTAVDAKLEPYIAGSPKKPAEILQESRRLLTDYLQKVANELAGKASPASQPDNMADKIPSVPADLKFEAMEEQLAKVLQGYFDGMDALMPKDPKPSSKNEKGSSFYRGLALDSIKKNDFQKVSKNAAHFIKVKKQGDGKSVGLALDPSAVGKVIETFSSAKSTMVSEYQTSLARKVMSDLRESLPHMYMIPPQAPDLTYTLRIAKPNSDSSYVLGENLKVLRAVDPKPGVTP